MDIREWLWKNRMSVSDFCRQVPMARGTFYRIFHKGHKPCAGMLKSLEDKTGKRFKFPYKPKKEKKSKEIKKTLIF